VPVAVTESVKLAPAATLVSAAGWVVIRGATTLPPDEELEELDDELLLEDELLELDEELDEDELLEGVVTLTAAHWLEALPAAS